MGKQLYSVVIVMIACFIFRAEACLSQTVEPGIQSIAAKSQASGLAYPAGITPVISNLTYDNITQSGVTLYWTTDMPADSKIRWMAPDSNYQHLIFTDSVYISAQVTNHVIPVSNLKPATIYKYRVTSQSTGGLATDSGYFITRALSTGNVDVYFNHTVNTSVSAGEHANGSQNFANLFINQINKAQHSIDITLWGFSYYTTITDALISAKNRGVKIRLIYNHTDGAPLADTLRRHGIPVLKRNHDTTFSMHNKFLVFDYRYNTDPLDMYLWTGSTNVSHPQFHSDRNNIILIQDESLCAVYTREFEEMWGSHTDLPNPSKARFGDQKTDNVPHILNVGGKRMEIYFTPSDSVSRFLTNLIQVKTTHSLFFSMLKFELPQMESTLHTVFNNGIQIRGVFDSTDSQLPNSSYPRMKGLPVANTWNPPADVFLDTIPGLIHHKYMIIDADKAGGNKITSTGSFNWETPADIGNDENSLTIFDARVNNLYYQEFYQRYIESGGSSLLVSSSDNEAPSGFELEQNYPNPFDEVTTIKFTITKVSNVKLDLYDILGCKVLTLVKETMQPGIYQYTIDRKSLISGVYFYKISAGNNSETKSMIIE